MWRVISLPGCWAVAALLVFSCGGKAGTGGPDAPPPQCTAGIDNDGDGYGLGCPAGSDCDDADPAHHSDCPCNSAVPREGCPCEPGVTSVSCFDGTSEQASTPPCAKGTRSCDATTQLWGECLGQVPPMPEACDGVDNDCDGTVDDGVLTACGDCTPGCDENAVGEGTPFPMPGDGNPLPPGSVSVESDGVGLDPAGDLILNSESIEYHFLWVANAGEGTVSKLDTQTGHEVARYASVTHQAMVDVAGAGAASIPAWGAANSPSRTAVDFYGNVWVGNRAFGYQPSATKIMNNVSDCVDRNGDGVIQTSTDVDGSGTIDLSSPVEFLAEADECIAFTVIVGAFDGYARAVAIDSGIDPGEPGNAWIGIFNEQAFYQLDGQTGTLVRRVPATGALGINPYGAAIDGLGRLWAAHGCCGNPTLARINTVAGTVDGLYTASGLACGGSYGITVDINNKVWLGAYTCASAIRYDPDTNGWNEVPITGYWGAGWGSRGIGADALGNVWTALHPTSGAAGGIVARIDATTLTSTGTWDMSGNTPVGAAVDFDGNVWTVNQASSTASRLTVDPVTHEPGAVNVYPVGNAPYTYSDFTGFGLRNITRATGDYTMVMEACSEGTAAHWLAVDFDATMPPTTSIEVWVAPGDDLATVDSWPQYGPWTASPADLQVFPGPVPDSRYLRVTLRLISLDRESTPVVHSWDLQWACPTVPVP